MDCYKFLKRVDDPDILYEMPTRKCLICSCLEREDSCVVKDVGWICPDCVKKIGNLIGICNGGKK